MTPVEDPSEITTRRSDEPRPAHRLVAAAFALYRRHALLFFVLAAGVIVPYNAIVLAVTGSGPFSRSTIGFGEQLLLTALETFLIGPLVSALHVHAVSDLRDGTTPTLASVAQRGLRVLPVVVAATVMAGLGVAFGFLLLVVPGVILYLRWIVVAQAAAIEHEGWVPALQRSQALSSGNYRHILLFVLYLGVIVTVPSVLGGAAFGHGTGAASFLIGVAVSVLASSFAALATALLYFDLRARQRAKSVAQVAADL